jgi:hypothetical protein
LHVVFSPIFSDKKKSKKQNKSASKTADLAEKGEETLAMTGLNQGRSTIDPVNHDRSDHCDINSFWFLSFILSAAKYTTAAALFPK